MWPSSGPEREEVLISQAPSARGPPRGPRSRLAAPSLFSSLSRQQAFPHSRQTTTACPAENAEWKEGGRGGKKKNSPSCDSYMGRSYKQFKALKLIRSLADEERVSIEADCNRNVLTVYSTYLFLFRKFGKAATSPPPAPIKSDHPTRLLFLSPAHLRNFNTAEYS